MAKKFLILGILLSLSSFSLAEDKPKSRLYEQAGLGFYDGSFEVTGKIQSDKFYELVESTSPTTPPANHARLFAVAVGTYTVIKAIFDDGTVKVITNN